MKLNPPAGGVREELDASDYETFDSVMDGPAPRVTPMRMRNPAMHTQRQGTALASPFAQPDDEVPPENPFAGNVDVARMEPARAASLVENMLYSPQSVTRVTRDFMPLADDVIVATNPRTGDRCVLRIIRLLNARDVEEFEDVAVDKSNAGVPWLESVFVNGDAQLFAKDQPGSRRLFKSHMAHQGLQVKRKDAPLFVSTARHPLDVSVSWYRYVRACYARYNDVQKFDAAFTADSFAQVQATTAQIMPTAKILTYEHIMLDWFKESKTNSRVFVVFYERLVMHPDQVIRELADFLKAQVTDERVSKIIALCRAENLLPEAPSPSTRARTDTFAESNGLLFSYESTLKLWERWRRALESTKLDASVGKSYEEFYEKATGDKYPFPKLVPEKPLKHGPLDEVGRNLESLGKGILGKFSSLGGSSKKM